MAHRLYGGIFSPVVKERGGRRLFAFFLGLGKRNLVYLDLGGGVVRATRFLLYFLITFASPLEKKYITVSQEEEFRARVSIRTSMRD